MSSGFVITIGCEEFFEDARKNIALYFNPEHMKTTLDLKHRVQRLIKQDFFLLWKPSSEESYYYLLDDEELHFVQPRDKFRLSKLKEVASTELLDSNGQDHLFNNNIQTSKVTEEKEKGNVTQIGQVEIKNDKIANLTEAQIPRVEVNQDKIANVIDVTEESPMEYEDVVDASTKKKRKRTRKHKSKKQKLETNENIIKNENSNEIEPTMNRIDHLNSVHNTVECFENNSRSHIRFQPEDAIGTHSNGIDISQTNQTAKHSEELDVNIDYEVDVKKKKRKSKKKVEATESTLENVTSTPVNDKITNVSSFSNNSNVITSTLMHSALPSTTKQNPRRRSHTNSLANFITQLSCSLNSVRTENSEVSDKHNTEPSECIENNNEIKHGNEVNLDTKPDTNFSNCNEYELTNSHRRLSKKNNRSNEINGTYNRAMLENIQQFKQNNFPSMPLVFERKKKIKEQVQCENTLEKTDDCPENASISNGIDQKPSIPNGNDEKPPMSNNIEERIAQVQFMSEGQVASLTPLTEPKENDVFLFKVLKMDASYNPTLSSYVCGKVKSVCKVTSQLSLDILNGHEELAVPQGKFSLDQEEEECVVQTEYSINWNELYDARVV